MTVVHRVPLDLGRSWLALLIGVVCTALFAAACGGGAPPSESSPAASADRTTDVGAPGIRAPEFTGLIGWLNSEPLTIASLREQHRVVLIDFWTYTCINCKHTLPYVRAWDEKYRAAGLTIVGVHTPEFDFEKIPENVAAAVLDERLEYPVAIDSERATWRAWENHVWPAKYLVGADGVVRYMHFGEGRYDETEQAIRDALTAAGSDVSGIPFGGTAARPVAPSAALVAQSPRRADERALIRPRPAERVDSRAVVRGRLETSA